MVGNTASNDVSIYLNKGNGTFIFKERAGMYWGVASPIYADFTGDGKNDIIATVGVPPSGIQSQLALIKGNVLNTNSFAVSNIEDNNNAKATAQPGNGMIVMNNPFINYLDIMFAKSPAGKINLQLTDVAGRRIAAQEFNVSYQSIIRFNVGNKVISGIYILTVAVNGKKYTAKVIRQ
jgi:hypothetical protein